MKLVQNISNTCRSIVGIKPTIYWQYRENCLFTFTNNVITAVDTISLGVLSGYKSFANAGHEAVIDEQNCNGFKHKLSAIVNNEMEILDKLEDVVFFVTTTDGKSLCLGAKYGMFKESQSQMFNDNLSNVAVEFGSRAGIEEPYDAYYVTADLSLIPNASEYEFITGLTLASGTVTPQNVTFNVDVDKTAYLILPDNTIITSTGGVIDYDYTGSGGSIVLVIPKASAVLVFTYLYVSGNFKTDYSGVIAFVASNIPTIETNNALSVNVNGLSVSNLRASNCLDISAINTALTAPVIETILRDAINTGENGIIIKINGGTSANYSTWSQQAKDDLAELLNNRGADIDYVGE